MKGLSPTDLKINVDRIPDGGFILSVQIPFDRFPALSDMGREEILEFLSPIQMNIRVRRISGFVEASGSLQTSARLSCSRCLGAFSHSLIIPFEATYTKDIPDKDSLPDDAEVELTAETIDAFHFNGKEIDLTQAVQEQILLGLPLKPLCNETCKGLCPQCGADLNKGTCGCGGKAVDPRFAVLKNLKLEKR